MSNPKGRKVGTKNPTPEEQYWEHKKEAQKAIENIKKDRVNKAWSHFNSIY